MDTNSNVEQHRIGPENLVVRRKLGWAKHLQADFDWDSWDKLDQEVAKMWSDSIRQDRK